MHPAPTAKPSPRPDPQAPLVEWAQWYATLGWPVFPLVPGKKTPMEKSPEPGRGGFHAATTDPDKIAEWWKQYPTANIGMPTGERSNTMIFDVDIKPWEGKRGDQTLAMLEIEHQPLPATVKMWTWSGSYQLFFAHQPEIVNRVGAFGPWLDSRAQGGYTILPPSRVTEGNRSGQYHWDNDPTEPRATLPDWLIAVHRQFIQSNGTHRGPIAKPGEGIPNGSRNDSLYRIGRGLHYKGLSAESIRAALITINNTECRPPLTTEELEPVIRQVVEQPDRPGYGLEAEAVSMEAGHQDTSETPNDDAPASRSSYHVVKGETFHVTQRFNTKEQEWEEKWTKLANFTAQVTEEILLDDGETETREFVTEGTLGTRGNLPSVRVRAEDFDPLSWLPEKWGVHPSLCPGPLNKPHLLAAIRANSQQAKNRHVYTHLGWREIDGEWVYLNHPTPDVEVELPRSKGLRGYQLPEIPEDVVGAVRASLSLIEVSTEAVTVPLLGAVYAAPLAHFHMPTFMVWLYGRSGALKSSLAGVFLAHFGTFDEFTLPGSWTSTANALEKEAFHLKDTMYVIDDWAPKAAEHQEYEYKANRLINAVGNHASRSRMTQDRTLAADFPPRGVVVSTAEQIPAQHSRVARLVVLSCQRDDVKLDRLQVAQTQRGCLPHALAGYVQWLAGQFETLHETCQQIVTEVRSRALEKAAGHLRTPHAVSGLWLGLEMFLRFAVELGAVTEAEAEARRVQWFDTLIQTAAEHHQRIEAERPTMLFLETLRDLIDQEAVVCRSKYMPDTSSINEGGHSKMIGWRDDDHYYLKPGLICREVSRAFRDAGRSFPVSQQRLCDDLKTEGITVGPFDGNRTAVKLGDQTVRVLKIPRRLVSETATETATGSATALGASL